MSPIINLSNPEKPRKIEITCITNGDFNFIIENKGDNLMLLQALGELNNALQEWDFDLNDELPDDNKLIIILQHANWQVVENEQAEIETKTTEYAVVWVKEYKKEEVN